MKTKITTLCAIILAGTQSLFSQWVIQNPGVNELFQKIDCVSGTNCFTCADNGTMLKTIDGSTWIDKSNGIPGNIFLHQLQVLDKDTVYVYGDLNLYRTFDGGENWTELPSSVGGGPHFFVNASIGYVSADDLYKTTDQGASWDLVKVDGGGTAMFFVNENFGIIARNTIGTTDLIQIYKTTDGGVNQTLVHQYSSSTGTIKDLQMISPQIGYACSLNGKILKTIDGGDNWTELTDRKSVV